VASEQAQDGRGDECPACRGLGWRYVRSRGSYVPGVIELSAWTLLRDDCWDCGGLGRAA
jgi:hypothetical protein